MPEDVSCAQRRYELVETFKHDFFAATGMYRGPDGQLAVLKINRVTNLAGIRLDWIGMILARREIAMYRRMSGVAGVPRLIGAVGPTALMHDFVPGHPLGRREQVSDAFFDQLRDLLDETHKRHMAYVDLNKRQNILMGDDGRPYLIDFQISLYIPPAGWTRFAPFRWFLTRFQQADWYHVLKHKRRLRPDQMTPAETARVERLSIWIRLHRILARPLTHLRRKALKRLQAAEDVSVLGSSAK